MHAKSNGILTLAFIIFATLTSCKDASLKADQIIINSHIWTANNSQPTAEAMAITGDSIIAIGTTGEIKKLKGKQTIVTDAKGAFITPGFIDSHVHLMMGGNALLSVELRDAKTPEEFKQRIKTYSETLEAGQWILEGNWDHSLWGGELPSKEWIDSFTKDNPVALYRLDGHMILANSAALKIAGIDKNTPNLIGGEIIRNADGSPTGILKGNNMNVVLNKIPAMNEVQKTKALKAATSYLLSKGVTSVHDVDSLGTFTTAKKLQEAGELNLRVYLAKPLNRWNQDFNMGSENNKWIKTGIVKGFVDGSLGSHTAAFHEPYTDKPDDNGFFINSEANLYEWISGADKANQQIMVHAIGDRAIHTLLNVYEKISTENGIKDRRLRIEHAQHIAKEDIKRFADLGVIASMQPYHAIDDGRWAEELIGPERIKTTYAFKSFLDANTTLAFGSDWPVAPATPLDGIYAAVTRRTLDNKNDDGWVPQQKITTTQALKAYTIDAAFASFDDDIKGSLEVGKLADFVILNQDLTKIDPVTIRDVQILKTFVGGIKVYDAEK